MHRTQIYLTDEQIRTVKLLAARSGLKQSEVIRKALDEFISGHCLQDWKAEVMSATGVWAERDDLPDFSKLRDELDRH